MPSIEASLHDCNTLNIPNSINSPATLQSIGPVTDPFPFLVSVGYRHHGTMGCQHS